MLDLRTAKRVVIIGGGTAGWFAALACRRIFKSSVEVIVVEDPKRGIIGVGEGSIPSIIGALKANNIDFAEFFKETNASYKLGISYENWLGQDEIYYHLFLNSGQGVIEFDLEAFGTRPLLAARIAAERNLYSFIPAFNLIANHANTEEAHELLQSGAGGLLYSIHFDSHKFAHYLKKIAMQRGILNVYHDIKQFVVDSDGFTRGLKTGEGEDIAVDFVIDASGLQRIGIGQTYQQKWLSYSDELILDRAIPFPIPHPQNPPFLYTRAIAMNSGWMWQIPLPERTGAGYVFSSAHISEEDAVKEAEKYVGHELDPRGVIKFSPGSFENIWCKNVLAIGLSAGFVEPLEATSIGQTLEVLRNFENTVYRSRAIIGEHIIQNFNEGNRRSWNEIRDFLRMHYDTPRRDTQFWRDVSQLPSSVYYQEIKQSFSQRMPRHADLEAYAIGEWKMTFGADDWTYIAAPLNIITPQAARAEIASMPNKLIEQEIKPYLMRLRAGEA